MTYALIGCGRIAVNHIKAAINNELNISAVCDLLPERMESLLYGFNLQADDKISRYINYRQMLDEVKPALAAIATPSGNHAEIALACIDKGINVIIEKPMALSLSDADMIIRTAEKKGVKVCACHQNRFNKSIQKLRKTMEEGRLGRLFHATAHIRWNRKADYYEQAPWRGTWAHDGGALMNQCLHSIDLLRWLMGDEICQVVGMTDRLNHSYIEAEDLGLALVRFANGSYGVIEGTTNIFPRNLEETLCVFGERGTVKVGGKSVNTIEEWRLSDSMDDPEDVKQTCSDNPPDVYGFGHTPLYKDVIEAIKNDRPVYIDAHAGRRALELVLAIYKSAADGTSVELPLKECSTLDFEGRFK